MEFGEIRLENVGPIRRAAIGRHRVSVFVGPNSSGKSIASRLIHEACRLGLLAEAQAGPSGGAAHGDGGEDAAAARAHAVLRGAGIKWLDAATRSMPSGRLELRTNGPGGTVLDFGSASPPDRALLLRSAPGPVPGGGSGGRSMYVPAGRTGTMQSLFALMQVRNDLFNSLLRTLADGRDRAPSGALPAASAPQLDIRGRMPEYLEQFYAMALETFSGGFDERTGAMFSRVFQGSIKMSGAPGRPAIVYVDPLGFETEIGSAASGIVSAFPIMAAVSRMVEGGMVVVEEPEEHLEPIRQIKLAGEIVRAALARRVSVVITTHSPVIADAILGLVGSGAVGPGDLGMYYFRRRRGTYTEVERIPVNSAGEAEQELFDEAIDSLAYGSAVPDAP